MRIKRDLTKKVVLGGAAMAVGVVVAGGGAAAATGVFNPGPTFQTTPGTPSGTSPDWPTNASGETYGSLQGVSDPTDGPVLTRVFATNGRTGYVYTSQLLNPVGTPTSPAAAVAQQAAANKPTYIPVYAQDGTTVIGQFEAAEPHGATTTSSSTPTSPTSSTSTSPAVSSQP